MLKYSKACFSQFSFALRVFWSFTLRCFDGHTLFVQPSTVKNSFEFLDNEIAFCTLIISFSCVHCYYTVVAVPFLRVFLSLSTDFYSQPKKKAPVWNFWRNSKSIIFSCKKCRKSKFIIYKMKKNTCHFCLQIQFHTEK